MRKWIYIITGIYFINYIVISFLDYNAGIAFLTSLFFPACFLAFLYKIDVFERERFKDILVVFFLSLIISAFICIFWAPLRNNLLGPINNGLIYNKLIHMFLGAGLPEEIIKIIPVLIVLKRTNFINEPLDYIIYASASALGFAFMENIGYQYSFMESKPNILALRALYPTIMHVATSSAIGLGLFFYHESKKIRYVILFYLLASIAHAVYNVFWPTLIILIIFYARLIQNLLNVSPFYNDDKINSVKSASYFLGYIILAVLLFDFVFYQFFANLRISKELHPHMFPYRYMILIVAFLIYKIISRHLKINKGEFKVFGNMKINLFSKIQQTIINNFYVKLEESNNAQKSK